mgnify:CR=1 FL=1
MKRCASILLGIITLCIIACQQQPDYVLSQDKMVALLVDVHKTEAVITLNQNKYPSNDKKRAMREAVFMRHNTTQAQFDTSLVWYGKHLDLYMEVYDSVIDRLKAENEAIKVLIEQDDTQTLTMEGDTVDIWKLDKHYTFDANKGENVMAFRITGDENFKNGDLFTLRFHVINPPHNGDKPQVYLAIAHSQQQINYTSGEVKRDGWNSISIVSDSVAHLNEIYGYISMAPRYDRHIMYIDSIELIRTHTRQWPSHIEYNVMELHPNRIKRRPLPTQESNNESQTPPTPQKVGKKIHIIDAK